MAENILFRPWKDLGRLQSRQLHYFVTRHLYPFSPYYRRLFDKNKINPDGIRTVEDLKKIPFTSKKDFFYSPDEDHISRNFDFVLQPREKLIRKHLPKTELAKFLIESRSGGKARLRDRMEAEYRPVFLTATAGTTRHPVPFLYTGYDIKNLSVYGKRIMEIFDIRRDEKAVNIFPYAPHLAFWQTVFAGLAANLFILSTGGGKTLGTEGNIRSILKVKPRFLIGVPGYVYHILKTARKQNHDMRFLKKIALGASRVPRGFKKKICGLLKQMGSSRAEVLGTYGFTEARCAWGECSTGDLNLSSGYHTYPDKEVFEIVDPDTGKVKEEGEDGEIVYSNIDARGSCVLRYRTGDLVRGGIVHSPCPYCGRTVPRISSDIGRASNITSVRLSKIKGTLINLNAVERLLDEDEFIDEWQIEIVKKGGDPYEVDEFFLYVSLLRDVNRREFTKRLNQKVFFDAEVSFNRVNFVSRREMHRRIQIESLVKAKKIVDKRPRVRPL